MNDFTKEELIELWEYCNWEPPAPGHSDFRQNLWLKIQSMIDNYCNHSEIITGAYPRSNPPKKCDACGVLYR